MPRVPRQQRRHDVADTTCRCSDCPIAREVRCARTPPSHSRRRVARGHVGRRGALGDGGADAVVREALRQDRPNQETPTIVTMAHAPAASARLSSVFRRREGYRKHP